MRKLKIFFLFLFSILVLNSASSFAALSFTVSYTEDLGTVVPRGSEDAPIGTMQLTATADNITVESITIENTGAVGFGSAEVSKVMMKYGDVEITELDPGGSTHTFLLDNPIAFDTGDQESFEFFYSISEKADIGTTVNFEIITVTGVDGGPGTLSPVGTFGSAKISGVEVTLNSAYTPQVVLPGAEKKVVAYFTVTPREEDMAGDDFSMTLDSGSGDDVTPFDNTNTEVGITKVYVYEDKGVIGTFEDPTLGGSDTKWFESSTFSDARTFMITGDFDQFDEGVSRNFWVLFDVGDNTQIGKGNVVQILISDLSSRGRDSGLQVPMTGTQPKSVPLEIDLAGLKLEEIEAVNPFLVTGPNENDVQVARFSLAAHELSASVNELTIVNSSNVHFVLNPALENGITNIKLYQDVNRDSVFDVGSELLLSDWDLGNANSYSNINTQTHVTITGLNFFIPTTNYVENNQSAMDATKQKFFILYTFGDDFSVTTMSMAAVNIMAGRATSNAVSQEILLSGTNESHQIDIAMSPIDVVISNITSLMPVLTMQSASDVPVISYEVDSSDDINSLWVELYTAGDNHFDDEDGISALRLYRDSGNNVYDSSDVLVGEVKDFDDENKARLPVIDLMAGDKELFFVLADLGKNCNSSVNIQISDLGSTAESVDHSELYPKPDLPFVLNVTENNLSFVSISSTASVMNVSTADYFIDVVILNGNPFHVTLNSVDLGFYENSIEGRDRSSEFVYSPSSSIALAPAGVVTVSFTVSPANVRSSTRFIIDPICSYSTTLSASTVVYLGRYQTESGYESLLGNNTLTWTVNAPEIEHYEYPAHIASVNVNGKPFYDNSVIAIDSDIEIKFADNGKSVKASSIEVMLNSDMLGNKVTGNYYSYDEQTGILTVNLNNNKNSGYIIVRCSDLAGNMYDDLHLNYVMETSASALSIRGLMTYPTPYQPGNTLILNGQMQIDFSITAAADVKLYIYNHIGRKVWDSQYYYNVYGDYSLYYDGRDNSGSYLPSGVYVLYAVATSSSGDEVVDKTVFAVK